MMIGYSGKCYKKNCVADKDIYYCERSSNNIYCKKHMYMPCKENIECVHDICVDETCQPEDYYYSILKDYMRGFSVIGPIILILILLQWYSNHREAERRERKQDENIN